MSQLEIVMVSDILSITLGVLVAIASIVVYHTGNSTIYTLKTTSSSHLNQASSMRSDFVS